jgi:hypothetical protein
MSENRTVLSLDQLSKYATFLNQGLKSIQGWLDPVAVEFSVILAEIQRRSGRGAGPVCEIGVWQGKSLTLLTYLTDPEASVIGVDPFLHCPDPKLQEETLRQNLACYSWNPNRVNIIKRDSKSLIKDDILSAASGPISIFHVDGDHTAAGTLFDLNLAASVLETGGLIIVDDISNLTCPGVIEATVRFCLDNKMISPFLIIANKLFLTSSECVNDYREQLFNECLSGRMGVNGTSITNYRAHMRSLNIPVHLCGSEVLVPAS